MMLNSIDQYRTLIEERTKDLDVGIVIANAGFVEPNMYQWENDENI